MADYPFHEYKKLLGKTVMDRAMNIYRGMNPLTQKAEIMTRSRRKKLVHINHDEIFSLHIRPRANYDVRFQRCFYISEIVNGKRFVRSQRWFLGHQKYYIVSGNRCTCPYRNLRNKDCKHILAVRILETH